MSSHTIRSFVAAATLTAGITWLTATPAHATAGPLTTAVARAAACDHRPAAVPGALTASCGGHPGLRLDDPALGGRSLTPEAVDLAMAAGRLARELGLTGLAVPNRAPGLIDLGGIVATWGMPSLTTAAPEVFPMAAGPAGMKDLATEVHVPELPALPVPGAPLQERVPSDLAVGRAPFHNRLAASNDHGKHKGAKRAKGAKETKDAYGYDRDQRGSAKAGLEGGMQEVGSKVISELLPKAMQGLSGTSLLPGGGSGAAGLAGLVKGFGLQ
ncbi:MAG TPA: hypothetical protein VFV66_31365 [Nonomuraea sp.]|nr:hypothetical protein [Nonomuraea sp.]